MYLSIDVDVDLYNSKDLNGIPTGSNELLQDPKLRIIFTSNPLKIKFPWWNVLMSEN